MHRGWVRFWRKSRESTVFTDELWRLWSHCLFRANHKPAQVFVHGLADPVDVQRGQFITGRYALHKEMYPKKRKTNPCAKTVWRRLLVIERLGNVSVETSKRFSVITINNFDTYNQPDSGASNMCPDLGTPKTKKDEFVSRPGDTQTKKDALTPRSSVQANVQPKNAATPSSGTTYSTPDSRCVQTNVQPESNRSPAGVQPESTEKKLKNSKNSKNAGNKQKVDSATTDIDAVWAHYKTHRPKARVLSDAVRKKIRGHLKDGFTVADLCLAIDGNYRSPHHCGQNDTQTEYHGLELIVRSSEKVSMFIEHAEKSDRQVATTGPAPPDRSFKIKGEE